MKRGQLMGPPRLKHRRLLIIMGLFKKGVVGKSARVSGILSMNVAFKASSMVVNKREIGNN